MQNRCVRSNIKGRVYGLHDSTFNLFTHVSQAAHCEFRQQINCDTASINSIQKRGAIFFDGIFAEYIFAAHQQRGDIILTALPWYQFFAPRENTSAVRHANHTNHAAGSMGFHCPLPDCNRNGLVFKKSQFLPDTCNFFKSLSRININGDIFFKLFYFSLELCNFGNCFIQLFALTRFLTLYYCIQHVPGLFYTSDSFSFTIQAFVCTFCLACQGLDTF